MNRDNQNELIADVYRAKLVYQAEMKSPEYQAKGEEDFEFIGKALAAKGYCKASKIFEDIEFLLEEIKDDYRADDEIRKACGVRYAMIKVDELKKEYERKLRGDEKV